MPVRPNNAKSQKQQEFIHEKTRTLRNSNNDRLPEDTEHVKRHPHADKATGRLEKKKKI